VAAGRNLPGMHAVDGMLDLIIYLVGIGVEFHEINHVYNAHATAACPHRRQPDMTCCSHVGGTSPVAAPNQVYPVSDLRDSNF
jgi:hypothetical protein